MVFKSEKMFFINLIIFIIIIIFAINTSNFVDGGKNQKIKQKSKITEQSEEKMRKKNNAFENDEQKTVKITHQCPEKNGKMENALAKKNLDVEIVELVNNFKQFFLSSDKRPKANESDEWLDLKINSLKWLLKRKIDKMLEFVSKLTVKLGDNNLLREIEKQKNAWEKTVDKVPKSKADMEMALCLMYENGVKILLLILAYYGNKTIDNEFGEYLREKRMLEIVQLESVNCANESKEHFLRLVSPPKIKVILGQTLMELLETSESFRHFLCHETEMGERAKEALSKIITAQYQTELENEFPEVLRIDFIVNTTIFVRISQLLINRSDSEPFKRNRIDILTALMIREMRLLIDQLQCNGTANDDQIASEQKPKQRNSPCDELVAKVNEAKRDTFRHFGSTVQLCVMIKISTFSLAFKQRNIAEMLTKKAVKKLRTDECEEKEKRAKVLEEFFREKFGIMLAYLISDLSQMKALKSILKIPGAKFRLLGLVGTERFEILKKKIGLTAEKLGETALSNDDLLWDHYLEVLSPIDTDPILFKKHKICADLAIFVRWLCQKIVVEQENKALFERIKNVIAETNYDPIFDLDEVTLSDTENFLRRNFFLGIKKAIENNKGKIGQKSTEEFGKIMEIIGQRDQTATEVNDDEQLGRIGRWIGQLHETKFGNLLKNGKMEQFKNVFQIQSLQIIRERMLLFFDANATDFFMDLGQKSDAEIRKESFALKVEKLENVEKKSKKNINEKEKVNLMEEEKKEQLKRQIGKVSQLYEQIKTRFASKDQSEKNDQKMPKETEKGKKSAAEKKVNEKLEKTSADFANEKELLKNYFIETQRKIGFQAENGYVQSFKQLECPSKSIPIEVLQKMDQSLIPDLDSYALLEQYIQLLWERNENRTNAEKVELVENVEIGATLLYYRDRAGELLKYGQLQSKNERFLAKINIYMDEFLSLLDGPIGKKAEEKMCQIYQFIYKMVKDDELIEMSEKWNKLLEENVKNDTFIDYHQLIVNGNIILFSEHKKQWHRIDCAVEESAVEFAFSIRKNSSFIDGAHLIALIRLIENSKQIQNVFCYGSSKNILALKNQIIANISQETLGRLEMFFPEIMHYDFLIASEERHLLLKQLKFKSGTLEAQSVEVRCSSPRLLAQINYLEKSFHLPNAAELLEKAAISRDELSEKIKSVKRTFYVYLHLANSDQLLLRKALCPLFFLYALLQNKISQKNYESLKDWYPEECETEEGIKTALNHNRVLFREQIIAMFLENAKFEKFCQDLTVISGAKSRFRKLFRVDSSQILETDCEMGNCMAKMLWTEGESAEELFSNESRLYSLYIEFLSIPDSMFWLNCKLKLDLFIFVQWIDAKISNFPTSIIWHRCANVWRRNKFLFYQMYDRWFDEPIDEMPNFQIYQTNFLCEINLFLEKVLQGKLMKSEKAIEEEMRKIIQKTQKNYEEKSKIKQLKKGKNSSIMEENNCEKFEEKLLEMKVKILEKMVEKNENFKKTLKFIYESFVDLNEMPKYLGGKTIGEIWKKLQMKYFEKEEKGEKEEKAKINLKNKKQKTKKNKKENKTEKVEKEENRKELEKISTEITVTAESTVGKIAEEEEEEEEQPIMNSRGSEVGAVMPKQTDDDELAKANGGTKIGNFADDHFLALKYAQIANAYLSDQQKDGIEMANETKLLNIGTFANEIAKRLEVIEWMGDQQRKSISDQWEWVKEVEYPTNHSYEDTLKMLCQLVMDLVEEMDEFGTTNLKKISKSKKENRNLEMEMEKCKEILEELHFRKFGIAIFEGRIEENWKKLGQKQKKLAISNIFGCDGEEKSEKILEEFQRNLGLLKRAESQQKLDKSIFYQYKNDTNFSQFIETKDNLNLCEKTSQLFPSKKWQEINSAAKEMGKKLKFDEKSSVFRHQNDWRETLIKLSRIFNKWSEKAQFQFPSDYFLKESKQNKFETICILPDEFDNELIFGKSAECVEKCEDNSLHCALCKKMDLKFLQKLPKNHFSAVPLMKIGLENALQIDVKFVQIVGLNYIPRQNFSAKQMEIFLLKLGQNIHKLENNYHFDERAFPYEMAKRKELREKNYENRREGIDYDAEELVKFDQITKLLHQNRAKAIGQMKQLKEWKESLLILSDHATNLKVLQFLLPESDYLAIVTKFELSNCFAINLLDKFRKILIFLEKWAKNNFIFCENLGYLSDEILLLMLTKVFVLFPNSSIPFLIHKFFLIYSKWKWPMPVQLVQQNGHKIFGNFLGWTPFSEWISRRNFAWENVPKKNQYGKEYKKEIKKAMERIRKELAIAVIKPNFGGQNVAEKVNISSAKVLRKELKKAWEKLRNKTNLNAIIESKLTEEEEREEEAITKFIEKYDQFIVVQCKGQNFNVDKLCEFVGKRLRYELLEFVENPLAIWVEFCHIYPKMLAPSSESPLFSDLDKNNKNVDRNSFFERHLLVGIQMLGEQKANSAFKRKLKDNLRKKMDVKLKEDFEKGSFHNIQLNSDFAERENLQNWHFYSDF